MYEHVLTGLGPKLIYFCRWKFIVRFRTKFDIRATRLKKKEPFS